MCYVWCVCFVLEAPIGPPMGGGVGFMGLISLMGFISLMGLIRLISLMREPIGAPLPWGGGGGGSVIWPILVSNMAHISQ